MWLTSRIPVKAISRVRGNGSRSEGQDVDSDAEPFDRVLRRNTKPLLFVDDEQAQIFEPDVFGEKSMGSDDHINLPGSQPVDHRPRLLGREEARQHRHLDRIRCESLGKRLEVLTGEQRRGTQDGHLLSRRRGLERRTKGHLSLAETDVSEHQAVHRLVRFHVGLDLGDRGELIRSLLEGERALHLTLPGDIGGVGMALGTGPRAVKSHHLLGDGGDGTPDPRARIRPLLAAHPRHLRCLSPGVLLDRRKLIGGDVQAVVSGVGHDQVVAFDPGHGAADHAFETSDPVLVVHDVVARAEVSVLRPCVRTPATAHTPMGTAPARDLLFAENRHPQFGEHEAMVDTDRNDGRRRAFEAFHALQDQPVFGQHPRHAVGGCIPVHRHHRYDVLGENALQSSRNRLRVTRGRIKSLRREHGIVRTCRHTGHLKVIAPAKPLVEIEEERGMRSRLWGAVTPRRGEGVGEVVLFLPEIPCSVRDACRVDEDDLGVVIGIEQGLLLREPRHPRLHACKLLVLRDPLPDRSVPRSLRNESIRRSRDRRIRPELASGIELHRLHSVVRPLITDCESSDLVDGVAPEVHPNRLVGLRRKDVHDSAANRELPPGLDAVRPVVAQDREGIRQPRHVVVAPGSQFDRRGIRRRETLDDSPHRRHDDRARSPASQPVSGHRPPCHRRRIR
jgi:hypothetical protein